MAEWVVVGGADKGGILVREDPASPPSNTRLSTGAVVQELEVTGGRLHYKLIKGTGPADGWVALKVNNKELVRPRQPAGPPESGTQEAPRGPSPGARGLAKLGERQRLISCGKQVVISGLVSRTELNGNIGGIKAYDRAKERFEVVVHLSVKDWPEIIALKPENLEFSDSQKRQDCQVRGDELMLVGEVNLRDQMYEKKLDAQYWYDKAVDRVLNASNEYEVLNLPTRWEPDGQIIRKSYRKISLSVHPDKNKHPQSGDAFRKVYGAFETLSDQLSQRKLLFRLGLMEANFDDDDEDELFEWWWEANIAEIDRAAAEAEGQEYDHIGEMWVSDGLGADVNDVKWISLESARKLLEDDACIFIDCREPPDFVAGYIPGAWNCPMEAFINYGVVQVLGVQRVTELLSAKRRVQPVVIYSNVATPFSRCRSLCRWLLRAGHKTLKAERIKRLKGGLMSWRLRKHPVSCPLMDQPIPPEVIPASASRDEKMRIHKTFREANKLRDTQMDAPWVEMPADPDECVVA